MIDGWTADNLISREALKKAFEDTVCIEPMPYAIVKQIIDNASTEPNRFDEGYALGYKDGQNERPQGKWLITAEDSEGIHRIQCPFCRYEKGSDFIDYITVTFEKLPPFCESCGAKMD